MPALLLSELAVLPTSDEWKKLDQFTGTTGSPYFFFRFTGFHAQHKHIEFTMKIVLDSDDTNAQKSKPTLVTQVLS